ncbi:MAG: tetratricopeptide repeat protein, partial [Mariniblastus sp.]|nr:tetratricopeptide repeat protein [Mariniblastus sp.]
GKYDEALPYFSEVLEVSRRTLGDEHPSTLRSINNMGVLLSNEGKYDEAQPYFTEALEVSRRTLGDDHPETLASISNMGNLLSTQGKYDEALPYMAEVLEVSRRTLGDEHPGTLRSISNMGMLFLNQGKYDEALPYFSEALEVSRRTLGDEHPNTLTSISNMGNLLNSQGKYDEALPHFTEALEAYRRTLGDEHPSTQQTQRGLNATLAALKAADENKDENKSDDKEADDKEADDKKEDKQPDDQQPDNQQPDKRSSDGADSPLDSLSPGLNEIQVEHEGQSRRLLITTPKSLAAGRPYPVLFCFHGAGGKADGQSKRWSRHADPRNLVVVSCEAVQPMAKWNFMDQFHAVDHDDVGLVTGVAKGLIAAGVADPRSIYATGHSSGGLFCYRLAKQTDLFAAFAPMSCGMVKGAHTPADPTRPASILQVIGDQDKSFHGSTNPKVTMYSAAQRIDIWRTFNQCAAQPVIAKRGEEVTLSTYANEGGIEVVLCEVKGEGHHLRRDLRDETDAIALDFLLKHRREQKPVQGPGSPRSE